MWHIKLEAVERRMWSKFRNKDEAKDEIAKIKKDNEENFRKYLIKFDRNKKITNHLADDIKTFLSDYEKSLIYWRDKFGYGMPLKDLLCGFRDRWELVVDFTRFEGLMQSPEALEDVLTIREAQESGDVAIKLKDYDRSK